MTAAHLAMLEKDYDGARGLLGNAGSVGDRFLESGIAVVREFAFQQYDALLCALLNDGESAVRSARKALAITSELRLTGAELSAIPELEIGKIICAAILGKNGQMFEAEKLLDDLSKNATELYRRDLAKWVSAALMVPSAEPSEEAETRANGFIILLRRAFESTQPIALTPAERRVLESLALGRASKEIAAITGRSVKTVDNQVASIMRKLSARSRGEAVARARRSGLLTDPAREASPV
jgi:DNA-binding CsgD family transcriptional regulator